MKHTGPFPIRLLERLDQLAYLIAGFVLVITALAITGYALIAFTKKLNSGFLEATRFGQAMVELGVSGALILAIGITLVILRSYLSQIPKPESASHDL